jgi:diguanylate cyclase
VAEPVDWKKKHLDSLREMEAEERRWRSVEQILRRLVQRLCAVAKGGEPRLDAQLDKLSAAARRDSDAVELKALFDSLTDTIMAVEKSAAHEPPRPAASAAPAATAPPAAVFAPAATQPIPVPPAVPPALPPAVPPGVPPVRPAVAPYAASPPARWDRSCGAVATLLDRLAQSDGAAPGHAELHADLAAVADDAALAGVLARVADLVAAHSAAIARERAEAAAMLAQVTERLEEMAIFLASASLEREREHEDTESLNVAVLAQMTRLSDEVRGSDDLGALRALVADRLEAVAANVRDFREREQQRFVEHAARTTRMRSRITELESETRELHRNLDLERRRSRIDPLTRVASRSSFNERFAEELVRWRRFRSPVSVLIWDVDHFKAVNDSCGHRGGDAVLREIAGCLAAGRREVDFLARYGGEEFVTLLIGTPLAEALPVAEQMRAAVEALRFHFRGTPVPVTVSCGLTELRDGDSAESVFDRADAALYRAKGAGRNRCVAG